MKSYSCCTALPAAHSLASWKVSAWPGMLPSCSQLVLWVGRCSCRWVATTGPCEPVRVELFLRVKKALMHLQWLAKLVIPGWGLRTNVTLAVRLFSVARTLRRAMHVCVDTIDVHKLCQCSYHNQPSSTICCHRLLCFVRPEAYLLAASKQDTWHSRRAFSIALVQRACAAAVPAATGFAQPACMYQQAPTVPSL